jgi:hypothetical protein
MELVDKLGELALIALHLFAASFLTNIVDDGRTAVTTISSWLMAIAGMFSIGCIAGRAVIILAQLAGVQL